MFVKVKKMTIETKSQGISSGNLSPTNIHPLQGKMTLMSRKKMTNENLIRYFYLSRREFFDSDSFLPQPP